MNNDIKHQLTPTELKLLIENAQLRGENKRQRELLRYLHVDWLKCVDELHGWLKCVGELRGWRKQLNGYVKAALED